MFEKPDLVHNPRTETLVIFIPTYLERKGTVSNDEITITRDHLTFQSQFSEKYLVLCFQQLDGFPKKSYMIWL